jgi:hypothetical protein
MAHATWGGVFAAGVLALAACAAHTLPEYAAPKGGVSDDPASIDMSDVISYRPLVQADFKSRQPPPQFAPYAARIGAATCGYIVSTPETRIMTQPVRSGAGQVRYRATPFHLRFVAAMDRKCSWWNPKDLGIPQDYILQHEQIHFAIVELEARRLNASVPELEARLEATAATREAAAHLVQQGLEAEVQKHMEGILARSRAFDEDTSMGHKPEQQKRWWNRVQSELAASDP